jgi:hypothetical protein
LQLLQSEMGALKEKAFRRAALLRHLIINPCISDLRTKAVTLPFQSRLHQYVLAMFMDFG